MSLVAVVDQVHTGIDAMVFYAGEVGDVAAPLGGIVADQIVAFTGLEVQGFGLGARIRTRQGEADGSGGMLR